MGQNFKTVYFQDHPATSASSKNIKLAFGKGESTLYDSISSLSSHEIRSILGFSSFQELQASAKEEFLAVNTFCKRLLKQKTAIPGANGQLELLPDYYSTFAAKSLHATFKGGKQESLQSWYPFLEGYSPLFVQEIINTFCPSAKTVYDPFAGSGTTPLTVARQGKTALYSEINPVLQHLIDVKIKALALNSSVRKDLSTKLNNLADDLQTTLNKTPKDKALDESYASTFGNSKFFDDEAYIHVLKMRSLVDDVACTDKLTSDFVSIATIASLVPASLLIRAGDLRFRTETELRRKEGFVGFLSCKLKHIASDLLTLDEVSDSPVFLTEDAKAVRFVAENGIDAVITSPPYLNGTNYFRNTKIELWFLRSLRNANDLSLYRAKAITAGINDVSVKKINNYEHPLVSPIIDELKVKAYDQRIPKMVASYFAEMSAIFDSISSKLNPNATLAIDIGDSIYSGVHVPTDRILSALLTEKGFTRVSEIPLRTRMSRNGVSLTQVLLVFSMAKKRTASGHANKHLWQKDWQEFKRSLPHQQQPFAKRNWGNPLHSLCSYQGKLKPSLAHHLVQTFVPDGGRVLDVFAGVGTIPFEASLNGKHSFGFEISKAAMVIADAKLKTPDAPEAIRLLNDLEQYIEDHEPTKKEIQEALTFGFNKTLGEYFSQQTLDEILLARRFFAKNQPKSPAESLVMASLLHILHGNRPYALSRRSHGITPFAPSGAYEYRPLIPRLREKVQRSLNAERPVNFVEGKMLFQDATSWWPREVDQLDAIITSPPFFNSTRFHLANWMRLWFCGWETGDFKTKPLAFVDEKQKVSFRIYEPIFRQARERLKDGGVFVLHLGNSKKCNMGLELAAHAKRWFKVADLYSESVAHCESHGIRDKGTVVDHQYLVLN